MSSACGLNSHVRISTLLSIPQALSLHFIRILPSDLSASFGDLLCQSPCRRCSRTFVYAPASQFALNCKKAARISGFPFACARLLLFPTKRARFDPTENSFGGGLTLRRFAGTPMQGLFRALHRNIALREICFFVGELLCQSPRLRTGVSSCSEALYQAVRLTQARSLKLLVSRVILISPSFPPGFPPPCPKKYRPCIMRD